MWPARKSRLFLEPLEDRTVPSTIVWTNRGSTFTDTVPGVSDADSFNTVFGNGPTADRARAVVDAAIATWESVIVNFNQPGGGNTLNVTIKIDGLNDLGASSRSIPDTNGRPTGGTIGIGRGLDGHGAGWFLDPTPGENSEYEGTLWNAFVGDPQPGSPAAGQQDLYSAVLHELGHVVGISPNDALGNFLSNTGVSAGDAPYARPGDRYWLFQGPSVDALFHGTDNRFETAHLVGPRGYPADPTNNLPVTFNGITAYGSWDLMNPVHSAERSLISNVDALMLRDAYGYTINMPEASGTFYSVLNKETGELLIRGGPDDLVVNHVPQGPSNDAIRLRREGGLLVVSVDVGSDVPGTGPTDAFVSRFDLSAVFKIAVKAGGGLDALTLDLSGGDPIPAGGISYDGGASDDEIIVSGSDAMTYQLGDSSLYVANSKQVFGTVALTSVNQALLYGGPSADTFGFNGWTGTGWVNGQGGSDAMIVAGTAKPDAITVTDLGVTLNSSTIAFSGSEGVPSSVAVLAVNAGSGDDTIAVPSTAAGMSIIVNGGLGNDAVTLGAGNLADLAGPVTVNGGDRLDTDTVTLNDQGTAGTDAYIISATGLTRGGFAGLTYGTIEGLTVNAEDGTNAIIVTGTAAGTTVTVNAGGGDDLIGLANGSLPTLPGPVVVNGQAGTDSVFLNDQNDQLGTKVTLTDTAVTRPGFGGLTFSALESVVLNAGAGPDVVNVNGTATGTEITVNAGGGNDTTSVGGGRVANLRSGLLVTDVGVNGGPGTDSLVVDDTANGAGATYGVSAANLSRTDGIFVDRFVNYGAVEGLTLITGGGADVVNVLGTAAATPVLVATGAGNDRIRVGNGDTIGIRSRVTAVGGDGTDTLAIDDSATAASETGAVSPTAVTGLRMVQGVGYSGTEAVQISTGSGNDFVTNTVPADGGIAVTLNLGAGQDGVVFRGTVLADKIRVRREVGPNGARAIAEINGRTFANDYANGEVVVVYSGLGNDTVTMDGTAGSKWKAEFHGEAGDDVLVGNQQDDRLDGGPGRNLLIGGAGADVLLGGKGNDILIGGTTTLDANLPALRAVLTSWTLGPTYDLAVNRLRLGIGPNRGYTLNATTITDDGIVDALTGGAGRDWFPVLGTDEVSDLEAGERTV